MTRQNPKCTSFCTGSQDCAKATRSRLRTTSAACWASSPPWASGHSRPRPRCTPFTAKATAITRSPTPWASPTRTATRSSPGRNAGDPFRFLCRLPGLEPVAACRHPGGRQPAHGRAACRLVTGGVPAPAPPEQRQRHGRGHAAGPQARRAVHDENPGAPTGTAAARKPVRTVTGPGAEPGARGAEPRPGSLPHILGASMTGTRDKLAR